MLSYSLSKDVGGKIFNVQYNKIAKLIHDVYENVVFETCYYLCDGTNFLMIRTCNCYGYAPLNNNLNIIKRNSYR